MDENYWKWLSDMKIESSVGLYDVHIVNNVIIEIQGLEHIGNAIGAIRNARATLFSMWKF